MVTSLKTDTYKNRVKNALDRYYERQAMTNVADAVDPGGPRPRRPTKPRDDEHATQAAVCRWLDAHSVLYCAVPNGTWLAGNKTARVRQMAKLKAEGLKPGVPDLLIFTSPPAKPGCVGTALELKRAKGGKATEAQRWWLGWLERLGWACSVQHGADAAIAWLESLGYGVRR